jgi:hypothetical protein
MLDFEGKQPPRNLLSKTVAEQAQRLTSIVEARRYSAEELVARRMAVNEWVIRSSSHIRTSSFQSISTADLGLLFHAIDEMFLEGCLSPVCEAMASRPLRFRLSTRMTSTGGTTTMRVHRQDNQQRYFEIAIATTPLFETFRTESIAQVGGVNCTNRLDALQRVMEHEMVHLVEMLLWQTSSCSAPRFQGIVKRVFGHTEPKHRMLTPRDIAQKRIGITVGDRIMFEHQGETLVGTVNRISKRATVLVPSENSKGILFSDGKRYFKFYVPLSRLKPMK